MDIGVPLKELCDLDIGGLASAATALPDDYWRARPLRRAVFAGGPHDAADAVVLRHEWLPAYSKRGFKSLHHAAADWCRRLDHPLDGMLPIMEDRCDVAWVYTFSDWLTWQRLVWPLCVSVAAAIAPEPKGLMMRIALVRLRPGGVVEKHIDGQSMADRTHRIHVPLSDCPECVYTIDGSEFVMKPGKAYDFNNKREHGVRNEGGSQRINLMLEYLPDPKWVTPAPVVFHENILTR